jgi:hypothetical protein
MTHRIALSPALRHVPRPRYQQLACAVFGALALAALPAAQAATGTIKFESAPLGPIGSYDPTAGPTYDDVFISDGFYVSAFTNSSLGQKGDLVASVVDGSDVYNTCWNMACPTSDSNSSNYLTALNDGVIDIFHTDPQQTFNVKSFDASFLGNFDGGTFPAVSGVLRVQGFLAGGGYLTQDFALDGPGADGFEFGHYTTTGAFATAEFTEILLFGFACETSGGCSVFSTNRGQFAIDNIATAAAVPEPSTWLMLGAGLLAIGAATRRRQA